MVCAVSSTVLPGGKLRVRSSLWNAEWWGQALSEGLIFRGPNFDPLSNLPGSLEGVEVGGKPIDHISDCTDHNPGSARS